MYKRQGLSEEESDKLRDGVDHHSATPMADAPAMIATMATGLLNRPRHLGIHSAGMVICDRPVLEVCPIEWGRMPGRTVLQLSLIHI